MRSLSSIRPSIWSATSSSTAYPPLTADLRVDAAVVGGGITGLTTALLLLRQGLSVAIVEGDRIASSTTGYTTAKLSSLHGLSYATIADKHGEEAARLYGEANQVAIEAVVAFARDNNIACNLTRMPAFTYAESEEMADAVRGEAAIAGRLGLPASLVTDTGLPFPVLAAVRFENQAMFHPRRYCLGLAEVFAKQGGRLFERTSVHSIEPGDPHTLATAGGSVKATHVVQATQLPLYDPFGFFTANVASQSYGMAVRSDKAPPGMYLSAETPARSIRPFVDGDNRYLIIGGEGHRVAREADTTERYRALDAWARQTFGTPEPAFSWSAHDYLPSDGLPYIGRLTPEVDGLWMATGFKKWGLTNGTVAALILSDLIAGRANPWGSTFDSMRLKPKSSANKLLQRQADLAARSAGPPVTGTLPAEIGEVTAGSGKVFKSGTEKVAVYRDGEGAMHTFSAVCTHMGCEVAFNRAERTWDCPCHGSRFNMDGTVIHGPAVNDLKPFQGS
jgi:glycine/D-amino acid oxidase-like deaminating enzyme/nitrite reductase/ring-hydroxylating ferredoxin subunit